jgi:hypothetical protein
LLIFNSFINMYLQANPFIVAIIFTFLLRVQSISSISGNKVQLINEADDPRFISIPQNDQTQWQDYKAM